MTKLSLSGTPLAPITEIGAKLNIPADALSLYGAEMAKLSWAFMDGLKDRPDGKLILVSAMTPTKFGEGKTTTSVGLSDGLSRLGKKVGLCLREPSLGPVFGMKGGGTGGGKSTMEPSNEINLHFTGDLHAITSAHNLLAAVLDNHIYWGNELDIDIRRDIWGRSMDMNERALRSVVMNLGGVANGYPRQGGFDITAASEVMAILCLAENIDDLKTRLGDIVVGRNKGRQPVAARELKTEGAMAALLAEALRPNLVQTAEGTPAFAHGGPFANIAHGCNSVIATKTMLKLADYVVTEAGFGADLGAEKFLDIKCRVAGLNPSAAVIVATIRALKSHGGVGMDDIEKENVKAVEEGFANLARHGENMKNFGLPVVVALNQFGTDTDAEIATVKRLCEAGGLSFVPCSHFADGGAGAEKLAEQVVDLVAGDPPQINYTYDLSEKITDKIKAIATKIYRADGIEISPNAGRQIAELQSGGWGDLPVCMAKTQYSFSADPGLSAAPTGFTVPIREVRLSAGARFVVAICGDMMTMPGLPRKPAAETISVDDNGNITGVF